MAEEPINLVLEHLRAVRAGVNAVHRVARVSKVRQEIDRIKRRLELVG